MRFVGNKIFLGVVWMAIAPNAYTAVELGINTLDSHGYALLKRSQYLLY